MAKTVAIVGASSDRKKFGNKAVRAYGWAGWRVFPVNPDEEEIEGFDTYPSLSDIPEPLDRVSMYVPTSIGKGLIPDIAAVEPGEVYFNPGADDMEVVSAAREQGLNVVEACSITDIGLSPSRFGDS